MNITYKNTRIFQTKELQDLFLSVKWESGKHPEKLSVVMENSSTVFSAWDNNKLIGLVNALDDNIMTAYVHFLLVNPDYQGKGIGKELLRMITDKYKDYLRIVLIADDKETGFYQNSGFAIAKGTSALFINRF
jgi:ribosomal protein S18 acetylase RimI-like enzyme